MATSLQPNGNPVVVDQVTLQTPGLEGEATVYLPTNLAAMRGAEGSTHALDDALRRQNVRPQLMIELTNTREVPVPGAVAVRTTTFGEPAITVEVPAPGDAFGQLVLYKDEADVATWHFARDAKATIVTRGPGVRTYVIPRQVPPPSGKAETRGLLGAVGKKVLKVLVFPLIDPLLGKVGDFFVKAWEKHHRPYRIRTFAPDDYRASGRALGPSDWQQLGSGRALLMVHGTFSLAHLAFGGLSPHIIETLHQRYQGRVFAFDHYTASEDPDQNISWFCQQIPAGIRLDVDIMSHSRGGLVARSLAHPRTQVGASVPTVSVQRVVFAGAPNDGTPLTDAAYMGKLLDSYTNLLNLFPDSGVLETLEAIVAVAKQLSLDTLKGLEGLQSMRPGGPFLAGLDQRDHGSDKYFALASAYHPPHPGPGQYLEIQLMNTVFHEPNDLVVPTASGYSLDGTDFVPAANRHLFDAADEVTHGGYFLNAMARQKILEWLP